MNKLTLIYVGRRWGLAEKIVHAYIEEIDFLACEHENTPLCFSSKLTKTCTIGNKIICQKTDKGVGPIEVDGKKQYQYDGKTNAGDWLNIWYQLDRAAYHASQEKASKLKLQKSSYDDCVTELKWIYKRLPKAARTSFIVHLLKDVQDGK